MSIYSNTKYTTLLSLIFSLLIFVSCKESNVTNPEETEIHASEIGFYHNKALDMIFNNDDINVNNMSYSDFRNVIKEKLTDKYPEKFNPKALRLNESSINKKLVKNVLVKSHDSYTNGTLNKKVESFNSDFQSLISEMRNKDKISQKFYERLKKLYSNKNLWFNNDKPVKYAENIVSRETLPNSDKKYADTFVSILKSSYQYWNQKSVSKSVTFSKGDPVAEGKPDGCTVAPYAADVTGGLYGMIAGPEWAVIEGGIFSAWTAVSCEYHSDDE